MAKQEAYKVDPGMLEGLIRHNVVTLRHAMSDKEWRADLESDKTCITPYVPGARGAIAKILAIAKEEAAAKKKAEEEASVAGKLKKLSGWLAGKRQS